VKIVTECNAELNIRRCPTGGCSNRNFVKPKDLITDKNLTDKVLQKVQESGGAAAGEASGSGNA